MNTSQRSVCPDLIHKGNFFFLWLMTQSSLNPGSVIKRWLEEQEQVLNVCDLCWHCMRSCSHTGKERRKASGLIPRRVAVRHVTCHCNEPINSKNNKPLSKCRANIRIYICVLVTQNETYERRERERMFVLCIL